MRNLKLKFIILVMLVMIAFSFSDCEKKETTQGSSTNSIYGPFAISSNKDFSLQKKINDWQVNTVHKIIDFQPIKGTPIEFDFTNLYIGSKAGSSGRLILANQVGFDTCNSISYGIGFYENEKKSITNAIIVKNEIVSAEVKKVEYYNLKGNLLSSLEFNLMNETIKIINGNPAKGIQETCGQAIVDCVENYYTQCGWASVALIIVTYFYPFITLLAVYDCAAQNCTLPWEE